MWLLCLFYEITYMYMFTCLDKINHYVFIIIVVSPGTACRGKRLASQCTTDQCTDNIIPKKVII